MRRRLAIQRGRREYEKQQVSGEPVFEQVKGARGLRQFAHAGLAINRCLWLVDADVHNLLKVYRAGVKHRSRKTNPVNAPGARTPTLAARSGR